MMHNDYVCPVCKLPLISKIDRLFCQQCGIEYPIDNGIPDFILEDLSKSAHPILRSVSRLDKLARIYETWLWYPIVYHFYGGLFIPSVKDEVRMITEMVDAENGLGLDVACGTGLFTRSVAKKMRFVYGVDISMGMLEKAANYAEKEGLGNIRFARAKADKLPFPDSTFDGVVCCGALHLFPDTAEALSEMARVMKKGSRIAVMTFVKRRFFRFKRVYEHLRREHGARIFDVEEVDGYLSQTGFKDFTYNIYGSAILFGAEKG
jgi:ubiquinone/menaquinone biosynthesis C-methylase UbiE